MKKYFCLTCSCSVGQSYFQWQLYLEQYVAHKLTLSNTKFVLPFNKPFVSTNENLQGSMRIHTLHHVMLMFTKNCFVIEKCHVYIHKEIMTLQQTPKCHIITGLYWNSLLRLINNTILLFISLLHTMENSFLI